ncbi:MAG: TonB-dependent receptor, partial [Saprospiraceae bacterium]
MKKLIFLLLLCATGYAYAQRTVTGKVADQDGQPLIGASILVKGTTNGTVSDVDGVYSVSVPAGYTTLVFSYTGFESLEASIGTSNVLDVAMTEGVILETAVITALGIARSEKSLGYAIAQVDGDDISKVRDPNIVNQLAGRAAGVTVVGSTGNFGGSARITIRGIKSISGNNQPLFVVDGVPMDNSNFTNYYQEIAVGGYDYGNAIQDINPNEVENISVLKGQAAAALYGSRGANGVIMITTKKGSKSRKGIGVEVSSSLTYEKVLTFPKFQNTYGGGVDLFPRGYAGDAGYYKVPFNELDGDGNVVATFQSFDLVPVYAVDESNGTRFATSTDEHFQHLADAYGYDFYNGFGSNQPNLFYRNWNSWDDWDTEHFNKSVLWEAGDDPRDFFETGLTSSHNLALNGSGEHSAFRLSYNRFDQKGLFPNSHMERNTIGFNGSLDLGNQLSVGLGMNYVNTRTQGRAVTGYENGGGGRNPAQNFGQWWHTQLRFDELKSFQNPDGSLRTWNRISADNPGPQYWDNPYWSFSKNLENDGRDRFFGNVNLSYKIMPWLTLTGRMLQDFYQDFRKEKNAVGSVFTPYFAQDEHTVSETNADLILRATRSLSDELSLEVFTGANKLWRKIKRNYSSTRGGLNVPDIYTVQNSIDRPIIETAVFNKQINSVFGGTSVGWKSTLFLDLTARQDWSSTLPNGANGFFYPSASLSYVFSEHLKIPQISFGKLRLGWAKVGNDTEPYAINTVYLAGDNFGSAPTFTVPDQLNNAKLKPEETSTIEAGLDLRFFKDRLGLDLTVYDGKTVNQIIPLGTTPTTGYTQQLINAGEISNKGIEVTFNATPLRSKNFNWDLQFNFGKNVNKLVELNADDPSLTNIPIADFPFATTFNAYEGRPYGTIVGTNYLFDKAGNKLVDPNSGFYMVSTDVMPLGSTLPDFTGGFSNTFSWKNLSLNVFFDFRKGGRIFSLTNLWGRYSGLLAETAENGVRENGVINKGMPAVLDAEGSPVLESGGDTETKLDDVYKSTGEANTQSVNYQAHDFFDGGYVLNAADVYDGSFIKLREVSLGYSFPEKWLSRLGFANANISLVGRNLAILFKNVPNLDPDNTVSASNIQGAEGGALPSVRSIGVNLNF